MTDEEAREWWQKALDKSMRETIEAYGHKPNVATMLRHHNGRFESVEIDLYGNAVEPEPRCPNCGPVLACSKHFVCT